ncbi:MAG: glycosyltransferase family 39 protein, partial [Acidimicrobiia bacterium]|nr:glycosyltransferase family 39 protein [Acidimicrobiia bacterium]
MRLPTGVWLSAGSAVAVLLATSARYGFHRDELYFVVAGRNLAWGYVDQPPFTPLIARISEEVGSASPIALRLLPALAVGLVAVLAAMMARRFGGDRVAQVFAAFTTAFTGVLLGEGHLLSTAVFDYAFWAMVLL